MKLFSIKKTKKPAPPALGKFRIVIALEPKQKQILLCNMTTGEPSSFHWESQPYKGNFFDEEFYGKLGEILEGYFTSLGSPATPSVTVLVPDTCVATNVLNLPVMNKSKTESSLQVLLDEIYKDTDKLKINRENYSSNKHYSSYAITLMRRDICDGITDACANAKLPVTNITFCSNASVNAMESVMDKVGNESFLLMNIMEEVTRFSLVSKGRTAGFYELPFGSGILYKNRLASENMLFDNPQAELLVLNAMEKAKAKQLTMMQADNATQTAQAMQEGGESTEDILGGDEPTESIMDTPAMEGQAIKVLPKKQPLKLPKFMLRPMPSGEQEYAYENFRIFIKWALNLIQSNKGAFQSPVHTVYVNMPKDLEYLFDMTNAEKADNGVTFEPLKGAGFTDTVLNNLELYGAFYDYPQNASNNF